MSYNNSDLIGSEDLVTYTNDKGETYGGGFNVNVVLMKKGFSPMITLNTSNTHNNGNIQKVSDLFENLAIPNWAIAYKNLENFQETIGKNYYGGSYNNEEEEDDEQNGGGVIDNDLYNKLLGLVTVDTNGNNINEIKGGSQKRKTKRLIKQKNKKTKKTKN